MASIGAMWSTVRMTIESVHDNTQYSMFTTDGEKDPGKLHMEEEKRVK